MTTQISILNQSVAFDVGVYISKLNSQMSLTNPKQQICIVMPFPTGSDLGFECLFSIPLNYDSSPVLVIRGVLDGTPANTLAFGVQQVSLADSESVDAAYGSEDTASNSTWTGYADEDMYQETITLNTTYAPGDIALFKFYRDDSVDTTTFDFLLTDLLFQYSEA